jgi:hypothetical protein
MTVDRSSLPLEGKVGKLRFEREGSNRVVMRFVLHGDGGETRPVEMRGEELRGVIDEGDRIAVADQPGILGTRDATLRPAQIRNLTTSGIVEMWKPGRVRRLLHAIGVTEIKSAAISASVGGVIAIAISSLFSTGPEAPLGGSDESRADAVLAMFLAIAVVFTVGSAIWLLLRPKRHPKWAVPVGLALGLTLIGLPLTLSQ